MTHKIFCSLRSHAIMGDAGKFSVTQGLHIRTSPINRTRNWRKDRRLVTIAENVKPRNLGWQSEKKTFIIPPGEKRQDIPHLTKAPTDKRLIGAIGAYKQPHKVKVMSLSPKG